MAEIGYTREYEGCVMDEKIISYLFVITYFNVSHNNVLSVQILWFLLPASFSGSLLSSV
jgi:hypothetical protein